MRTRGIDADREGEDRGKSAPTIMAGGPLCDELETGMRNRVGDGEEA